jgi:hypothetical protein
MKKSIASIVIAGIAILIIALSWQVNIQLNNLQAQNSLLQSKNIELENKVSALQIQTLQMRDRIIQLLEQSSETYKSPVQITAYQWIGGFHPYVGMTLFYPVNFTLRNTGLVDANDLSISIKLINVYNGSLIGLAGGGTIGSLSPGQEREIQMGTCANLDQSLVDAVCVLTLKQGNTVIDEWIRVLN